MNSDIQADLVDYAGKVIGFDEVGAKTLKAIGLRGSRRVMEELIIGATEIRNEIVLSMRNTPTTGKLYFRRWGRMVKKTGKRKAIYHRASQPGFPPAVDTGRLINSIVMDARFTEVEVGSIQLNPAYPKWLEKGTAKMDARPWLEPAVMKFQPRIRAAIVRTTREIADEMRQ